MNRFFTIVSFCVLSAGAPAVSGAMGPGGGYNAQTPIRGQEQQPGTQQSPQKQQQQQQAAIKTGKEVDTY